MAHQNFHTVETAKMYLADAGYTFDAAETARVNFPGATFYHKGRYKAEIYRTQLGRVIIKHGEFA